MPYVEIYKDVAISVVKGPHNLAEDGRDRLSCLATLLPWLETVAHCNPNVSLIRRLFQLYSAYHQRRVRRCLPAVA